MGLPAQTGQGVTEFQQMPAGTASDVVMGLATLPEDFFAEGRDDTAPQERYGL